MIKLLFGGSPCTFWSIARTNNRETVPKGLGWELFENFLIAKEKYMPDYFLYENNKSMAKAIKEQISKKLAVEPILINSSLVSAQNRQRYYWTNIPNIQQPKDKEIILQDILENNDRGKTHCPIKTCTTAIPLNVTTNKKAQCLRATYYKDGIRNLVANNIDRKTCVAVPVQIESYTDQNKIYKVESGIITIKDKPYPIKLLNGYYAIRKLSVIECKRLQTVPDEYFMPCSNTQSYKMLGNGWTVDVIVHILSHIPNIQSDPVEVLSMYDGMSCSQIALKKVDANVIKVLAMEIDKYCIQTTMANFPNTIQLGDAFQVREADWSLDSMV